MPKCAADWRIFGWPASFAAAGTRDTTINSRETVTNMGNLRSGDGPGQPGWLGPGGHGRDDAVGPDEDGEGRVVGEGLQAGGSARREAGLDPRGIGRFGGDPYRGDAVPVAQGKEVGFGAAARGQE